MSYASSFVQAEPIVAKPAIKIVATKAPAKKAEPVQANSGKDITIKIILFSAIVACVALALTI
jgi:hypothetical protein